MTYHAHITQPYCNIYTPSVIVFLKSKKKYIFAEKKTRSSNSTLAGDDRQYHITYFTSGLRSKCFKMECTFWMMKNTQTKATQRTNDTRIQLQLQLIQRLLS